MTMLSPFRLATLAAVLLMAAFRIGAEQPSAARDGIHAFVGKIVKEDDEDASQISYGTAAIPETDMILVYLSGGGYCGSGGCTLLILKKTNASYTLVNSVTISWPPILALKTKSEGAPDLGVTVAGGGLASYVAALPFDGKRYAGNPSAKPAYRAKDKSGTVLIESFDSLKPLSP